MTVEPQSLLDAFHNDLGVDTGLCVTGNHLKDDGHEFVTAFDGSEFKGLLINSDLLWTGCNRPTRIVMADFFDCLGSYDILSAMRTFYKGI